MNRGGRIDRGNPFDPLNNQVGRDANPKKHIRITKLIYDFYIQFPDKCPICSLDYYSRYLGLDIDPPECIKCCRMQVHRLGNNLERYIVETKTQGLYAYDEIIYISRGMLLWLYANDIPIVLRAGKDNGLVMHHINRNRFDDRPENIVIMDEPDHPPLHGTLTRIDNIISGMESRVRSQPTDSQFKKMLSQQINLRNKLLRGAKPSPRIQSLITDALNEAKRRGM